MYNGAAAKNLMSGFLKECLRIRSHIIIALPQALLKHSDDDGRQVRCDDMRRGSPWVIVQITPGDGLVSLP